MLPSFTKTCEAEARVRASHGNAAVDKAFLEAGLTGKEPPTKVRTFVRKLSALQSLDPSIAYPQRAREAMQSIALSKVAPGVASVDVPTANTPKIFQPATAEKRLPEAAPAKLTEGLHGIALTQAAIRADIASGRHGVQAISNDDEVQLPPALANVPPVDKMGKLSLDNLGLLALTTFGAVAVTRLVSSCDSNAATRMKLERQFWVEGYDLRGNAENSFPANLKMTPPTVIYATFHRRAQTVIDLFLQHLSSNE